MGDKIAEFKIIEAKSLDDFEENIGLNTKANELIKLGFVPYGDLKLLPKVTNEGMVYERTKGHVYTTFIYIREFVKYVD